MDYPLDLAFKIFALAPQIKVTDAQGAVVFYVKQKLFKLKESVTVFSDETQGHPICTIQADRIIDFSAEYRFADVQGNALGSVKRQGVKSFWRARYDIRNGTANSMTIQEANPWSKVFDSLLGEIPILGLLTGYFFNPVYHIQRSDGKLAFVVTKRRTFLESRFRVERQAELAPDEELRAILSLIMMVLLERARG